MRTLFALVLALALAHMPRAARAELGIDVRAQATVGMELVVGGESFATGTDVLELDDTGRIVSITGFLDRAPAGFDPDAHH